MQREAKITKAEIWRGERESGETEREREREREREKHQDHYLCMLFKFPKYSIPSEMSILVKARINGAL